MCAIGWPYPDPAKKQGPEGPRSDGLMATGYEAALISVAS